MVIELGADVEQSAAIDGLSALAQPTRLAVFRLLVRSGPDGLAAGAIAALSGVQSSTLSHHLAHLERARLVTSRRDGRSILYAADYAGIRALFGFLMDDCCAGWPELREPAGSHEREIA